MSNPTSDDLAPNPKQLKELQRYGGEFNWLATRTRPDLAYYTSVIASTATQHGNWCLQMCRKVLRYLLATRDQGILMKQREIPRTDPEQLTVWTDAGYGGVGTKAQTGILVSWDGACVLARSSRQATAALSTCEAEVAAAASGYVVVEGLRTLLNEWGLQCSPPLLLIDNKSALTVCGLGGTWRTRYFAVRAARIAQEHALGNVELRYCETSLMAADGLTKLASATVMDGLREVLDGNPPSLTTTAKMQLTDDTWWVASLRSWRACLGRTQTSRAKPKLMDRDGSAPPGCTGLTGAPGAQTDGECSAPPGCTSLTGAPGAPTSSAALLSIQKARQLANEFAEKTLEKDEVDEQCVLKLLQLWGFSNNRHRPNVCPEGQTTVHSDLLGLTRTRTGIWMPTNATTEHPAVAKLLNKWLSRVLETIGLNNQWKWTSITLNSGYSSKPHRDGNNFGPSIIRTFGNFEGGGLNLFTNTAQEQLDIKDPQQVVRI